MPGTLYSADVLDQHPDWDAVGLHFQDFGSVVAFHGAIETVKVFEDNVLVKQALGQPGRGRVLVVDGGGSRRCALCGGNVAVLARDHGWAGLVIFGAIRDRHEIAEVEIGVKALGTHPRKSRKRGEGQAGIPVTFAGVTFKPGAYLVADGDGIVVGPTAPSIEHGVG
ncbi:MAG: ribonuclease E activity regulator RraA [Bacteroidota bacterium]